MILIFIEFIIVACIVVVASKRLATDAEIIEQHSSFNPIFMGLVLSAATSLPELVSSLTSISLGNDVTAVSNVLGSNVFNVFALAMMNIILFRKRIFRLVAPETFKTASIAIVMYSLMIGNLLISHILGYDLLFPRMQFTITSALIAIIYCYSVYSSGNSADEIHDLNEKKDLSREIKEFVILVFINVLASMVLAHKAEDIVLATGMSEGIVGAVLVGIATSLPEIITCYALIKKNKNVMAVTSILGSNTFNFVTFVLLDFSTGHSIYENMDISILLFALTGLIFSIIMYNMGKVKGRFYLVPSIIVVIIYFVTVGLSATL